jgi:hypothetical protein
MFAPFAVRFSVALVELAKVSIRKVAIVSIYKCIIDQSNKLQNSLLSKINNIYPKINFFDGNFDASLARLCHK